MNLAHHINWAIFNWPTLYRCRTKEESRLRVFNHIFLSYGTGYEWHPDGFLAVMNWREHNEEDYLYYDTSQVMEELSNQFFDRQLYSIQVEEKDVETVKEKLDETYYYITARNVEAFNFIFEATEDEALDLSSKFDIHCKETMRRVGNVATAEDLPEELRKKFVYVEAADTYTDRIGRDGEQDILHPTGICEYSPVHEMIMGKTNSPHINNFQLKTIKPDWIMGAAAIVKYALNYYHSPKKFVHHYYYYENSTLKQSLKKAIEEGREEQFRKNFNLPKNKTAEQRAKESWYEFREEQLDLLLRFLEKFGNPWNELKWLERAYDEVDH